jgi:phage anti-repressor protein
VNYALVDTPDNLIGYEPMQMHVVSHIPEHMRITTWTVKRDMEKEAAIAEKVKHAREYFLQVLAEFEQTHKEAA